MILPIIGLVFFLSSAISHYQYNQLIVTMTFIAIFLGGYYLKMRLREDFNASK